MRSRLLLLAAVTTSCLVAAGCSEQQSKPSGEHTTPERQATTQASAPPATSAKPRSKPKIAKPTGAPPKQLVIKDLIKGKGAAAATGDQIEVNYVGVNFKDGKEFDSSFKSGQPFQLQLGAGMVIPGWDKGIVGMKVGGRRTLTIPPALGYGADGSPPAIAPNETLVFVIDLLSKQ